MKKTVFSLVVLMATIFSVSAQNNVGIGTDNPHSSAALEVSSNDKGVLIPRMTAAQRGAIPNPAEGLMIFQTDETKGFYYFNGAAWAPVAGGGVPSTGIIMSETKNNPNLTNGGFTYFGYETSTNFYPARILTNYEDILIGLAANSYSYSTYTWVGNRAVRLGGADYAYNCDAYYGTANSIDIIEPIEGTVTRSQLNNEVQNRAGHSAIWTGTELLVWGGYQHRAIGCSSGSFYILPQSNTGYKIKNFDATIPESTQMSNAPIGVRFNHTAVWTGTEMIIWGGGSSDINAFNDGAKYNPTTNTWTTISATNAPSARQNHTAIWTGTEMIVWGGWNGTSTLDNGAKYNPITDTWSPISATNAPSARSRHAAIWTGTEMIVWGGYVSSANVVNGAKYNPSTNTWTSISTTNAPRPSDANSAVWTGSKMYVDGGFNQFGNAEQKGIYTPATDTWESVENGNIAAKIIWTGSQICIFNTYHYYNNMPPGSTVTPLSPVNKTTHLYKKN